MLSTGDLQNYLRKLQTELRLIKFRDVDYKSLQAGNPCELLKIYHYVFLDFNPLFAKNLLDKCNCDFYGKTDSHFIDTMYKALRDHFSYKPPVTKEQFFITGFAERKLQMACDVIALVRQQCKEINLIQQQQQQKRSGASSARLTNGDREKKRISSSTQSPLGANVFHPLRDMGLETSKKIDHDIDEFASIQKYHENHHLTMPKQQHIENWLDGSEFESSTHPQKQPQLNEPIPVSIISRLEEQIQMLKVKVEDINARLENVTSILQETHSGNNLSSSADISNFNARLVIVENELSMLRRKTPQNNENRVNVIEPRQKQTFVPQGILVDSDEDENIVKSYAVEESTEDFDIVERARSLLENADQCNRDLLKKIQTKS
ncbi:unnamed protein product [Rotaria socialis]|uniref:Centrosomal protein of 44 kDa n=1 Tax=Rotaria socialis TaxID=392032 RepID=A0A818UV65_9BILA|nr:unnamed protein product [Rotaria socialis]CAF3703320.1 unnamed protein product [Rotaria socialis]CAF4241063.1 unnamed protein product [Rotaria socialis]CAF4377677.1 unnamed protein product [Rotaria socialis]